MISRKNRSESPTKAFNSTISKFLSPTGCSKTSRALTDNVDMEITQTLRHQKQFEASISNEYKKLNYPLSYYLKSKTPHKVLLKKQRLCNLSTEVLLEKRREHSNSPKLKSPRVYKKRPSPLIDSIISTIQCSTERLPPLIKSTPIHLDPNLQFLHKKNVQSENLRGKKLSEIESLIGTYVKNNSNNVRFLEKKLKILKDTSEKMNTCIDEFFDIARFSTDNEVIANLLETRKENKKCDLSLQSESKKIQRELTQNTNRLVRGFRYRKMKGAS